MYGMSGRVGHAPKGRRSTPHYRSASSLKHHKRNVAQSVYISDRYYRVPPIEHHVRIVLLLDLLQPLVVAAEVHLGLVRGRRAAGLQAQLLEALRDALGHRRCARRQPRLVAREHARRRREVVPDVLRDRREARAGEVSGTGKGGMEGTGILGS